MIDGRAAVGDGVGGFSIEPVVVQAPGRDEVLLELKASGVCHTDWDSLSWGRRVVLGHEGAGVVLAVGEGVTSVKAGDAVVLNWAIPCGTCYPCERGSRHICENHNQVTAADVVCGGVYYWLWGDDWIWFGRECSASGGGLFGCGVGGWRRWAECDSGVSGAGGGFDYCD